MDAARKASTARSPALVGRRAAVLTIERKERAMAEVKLTSDKGSMEKRIGDRLRPSTAPNADHVVTKGSGPTRVVHAVHSHGQGAGAGRGPKGESK
jgi:hypothetical protein